MTHLEQLRHLVLDHDSEDDSEGNIVIRFTCAEWLDIAMSLNALASHAPREGIMSAATLKPWTELVEAVRCEHNGIFGVRLFLGHDGHNVCQFDTYDETLARGESGQSMQEAVERCIDAWKLEAGARWFARNPD